MRFIVCLFSIPSILHSGTILVLALNYGEATSLPGKINEHSLLTIQGPNNDIIDCVDKTKQLAFDPPTLKDQVPGKWGKVENTRLSNNINNKAFQVWSTTETKCPSGTDPIRRTMMKSSKRANDVAPYGKKQQPFNHRLVPTDYERERSTINYKAKRTIHGTIGTLNIWNPDVEEELESSLSQVWVIAGEGEQRNTIEAGWHVAPWLHHDYETRFFISWTNDNYGSTGCYNLYCPGFELYNQEYHVIGGDLEPSLYGTDIQAAIEIRITQNNVTNAWWLIVDDMEIGYWPSKLFSLLGDGATEIEWGGEVHNQGRGVTKHTTTEMGSGKFATERYEKACYVGSLFVTEKDMDGTYFPVQLMLNNTHSTVTHPKCYSLIAVENSEHFWVYFGGPGYGNGCTT